MELKGGATGEGGGMFRPPPLIIILKQIKKGNLCWLAFCWLTRMPKNAEFPAATTHTRTWPMQGELCATCRCLQHQILNSPLCIIPGSGHVDLQLSLGNLTDASWD